jgi:hypothetical protein
MVIKQTVAHFYLLDDVGRASIPDEQVISKWLHQSLAG